MKKEEVCGATKKNGEKCVFAAKEDGFCGHHKLSSTRKKKFSLQMASSHMIPTIKIISREVCESDDNHHCMTTASSSVHNSSLWCSQFTTRKCSGTKEQERTTRTPEKCSQRLSLVTTQSLDAKQFSNDYPKELNFKERFELLNEDILISWDLFCKLSSDNKEQLLVSTETKKHIRLLRSCSKIECTPLKIKPFRDQVDSPPLSFKDLSFDINSFSSEKEIDPLIDLFSLVSLT